MVRVISATWEQDEITACRRNAAAEIGRKLAARRTAGAALAAAR